MTTFIQDVHYAVRQLRKSPGFTFTAIVTLALGIGATTAMFSVVLDVLLRPLRYPAPGQLVVIRENISTPSREFTDLPINANHLVFWQQQNRSFSSIAALQPLSLPVGGTQTEEIGAAKATFNLISTLGFQAVIGRTFTEEEEKPGHNVVLLTDGFWKRRYGADPAIVGKTVLLDGLQYLVVGVLPAEFSLPDSRAVGGGSGTDKPIEAFIPFGWSTEQLQEIEGDHNYFAIARLRADVSIAQASAELNALQRQISQQTADKANLTAKLIPFQEYLVGSSRRVLLLLLVAVSGLLACACINLTNLLLARAAGREHEAGLRIALGASRTQIMRHALMEPLLVVGLGGAAGMLLARLGLPLLVHRVAWDLPGLAEVRVDAPVLFVSLGVSAFVAIASGFLPAWRSARKAPQAELHSETRTTSASRASKRLKQALILAEAAASVTLVLLSALFVTSLMNLRHVDRGFQTEHVLSATLMLPSGQYGDSDEARNTFYERALARLREIPGVSSAGAVSVLPLDGDRWSDLVTKTGDTRPAWQRPGAHFRWITPGYMETLRVPLLAGRFFTEADRGHSVALISERVARTVWPNENPIGQRFTRFDPSDPPFQIVGVVGDIRTVDLAQEPPRMVYVPYWYRSRTEAAMVLRTTINPSALADVVRKTISEIDPQAAVPNIRTMDDVVEVSVAARRFQMELLLTFAICALLLAALGTYGVVAYSVVQRTPEIGIRIALGASRRHVYRMIVVEAVTPVLIGAVTGVASSWFAGRIIANLLFEVRATNPLIAAISCVILVAVGVMASLLPAARAAVIDPMNTLRSE
jgi:macrolide transport system ATP-binding/permease protein